MTPLAHPATWLAGYIPDLPTPSMKRCARSVRHSQNFANARSMPASRPSSSGETAGEASTLTPVEHEQHRPDRRRDRAWPRPRHCRRGIEFDQPGHRADAARRSRRRRCGAFGRALLQQADAGRHLCALSGDRRLDLPAHHPARHSLADYPRIVRRHPGAAGRIEAIHRIEGRHRRYYPSDAPAVAAAAGVSAVVRRRRNRARLHRQWRGWLHIADFERRAGSVPGDLFELPAGTNAVRAISAKPAGAADGCAHQGEARPP